MKLKKSYSTQIVAIATVLLVAIVAFVFLIPIDALKESQGLLTTIGVMVLFIVSVVSALSFGYLWSKNEKGESFTFKEFNPGIEFSIKALDKKEPEKKSLFLDDTSFQYIVSCGEEMFLLADFRSIPEGDYFKDSKTGRIKRVDTNSKDFRS